MPTQFEIGVIFRITPSQANTVLRTYQARFSESYRKRLQSRLTAVSARKEQQSGTNVFVFEFDEPELLDYAVERLRRRGLTRSVTPDKTNLTLTVDRDQKDRFAKDADAALKDSHDRG